MEVVLKLWKSNKHAACPTCNSLLQVPFWFWLIDGASGEKSKYWCHGFHLPCFDFWPRFALSFCTHGGRSQHSVAECCRHTCALLNFDGTFCLGRSAFFSSKVLFLLRAVRTASESTEKCVQSTEISVQFGPVRTQRIFFEKAHLFLRVRPSISQR